MPCPKNPYGFYGLSATICGPDCGYFYWGTATGTSPYTPTMAKTIDQFTTDELLAEIRKRMLV
jgi:hypothetical protein